MKKLNLLIADDSDEFRGSLVRYFQKNEQINIVAEAVNGMDALEKIQNYEPDVLLLDIVMPELDGYGVLKNLNALKVKKPYVIMISQLHTDICINKAISSGADYYLLKPVNMQSLHEHLMLLDDLDNKKPEMPESKVVASFYAKPKTSLDEKIANIFISVGIPAHIKGYQFLREAIKLAIESPDIINSITKKLYPSIAKHFDTSSSKVERAIRHAIEVAWNRGKIENINNLFGMKVYNSNDKPTNGEFIALIADKMLIEGA